MDKKDMAAARKLLSEWIRENSDLHCRPELIRPAGEFEQDGRRYYIFKFRMALLNSSLLGLGSAEADYAFSLFRPYRSKTALQQCREILSLRDSFELFTELNEAHD